MKRLLALGGLAGLVFLSATAPSGEAREMVSVKVADGVTQSYLLAVPAAGARAVAILFPGGYGKFDLESIAGRLKLARGNFLIRTRGSFVAGGVATAVIDTPSDQPNGMTDEFRLGPRHANDVAAVVADLKTRFPGVPVFLVGTSRGSVSAASVGARIGDAIAGVALTSSMFRATNPRSSEPGPGLSRFDFASLKVPVLLVHHRDDTCASTPYLDAHHLSKRFPLVSVKGGLPRQSDPCQAMSAHGYLGKEAETVDAIVAWMLGKPYPREIE
jgi:pimeloyl-ACP methyl ester carboxylesterase